MKVERNKNALGRRVSTNEADSTDDGAEGLLRNSVGQAEGGEPEKIRKAKGERLETRKSCHAGTAKTKKACSTRVEQAYSTAG